MINLDNLLTDLCNDMTSKLATTIRANENDRKPDLNFITVDILSKEDDHYHDEIENVEKVDSVDVIRKNTMNYTLSIKVHTKRNYDALIDEVFEYFKSKAKTIFNSYEITIHDIMNIGNNNNVLGVFNHNISQFDIHIKSNYEIVTNVPYIEKVEPQKES